MHSHRSYVNFIIHSVVEISQTEHMVELVGNAKVREALVAYRASQVPYNISRILVPPVTLYKQCIYHGLLALNTSMDLTNSVIHSVYDLLT